MPTNKQKEYFDSIFGGKPTIGEKTGSSEKSDEMVQRPTVGVYGTDHPTDSNPMLKISLERLHPPQPIVSETAGSKGERPIETGRHEKTDRTDSTLATGRYKLKWEDCPIEYQEWCLASETYRFYIFTNEGKTSRKTGVEAMSKIVDIQIERDMVKKLRKMDPNEVNFRGVMNEFKEKVKQIRGEKNI